MYQKSDIHIGDPYYYVGKHKVLTHFHLKDTNQVFLKTDNPIDGLYLIGYKKQIRELIDDLEEVWQSMKD